MNLKPVEIGILALSPTTGAEWTGEEQKIAHRLVKKGFLESDLAKPSLFRCTSAGVKALKSLVAAHGGNGASVSESIGSAGDNDCA